MASALVTADTGGMGQMRRPALRLDRTTVGKTLAVAVMGLLAPVFVSTPLSASDTHGAPATVGLQTVAGERR